MSDCLPTPGVTLLSTAVHKTPSTNTLSESEMPSVQARTNLPHNLNIHCCSPNLNCVQNVAHQPSQTPRNTKEQLTALAIAA